MKDSYLHPFLIFILFINFSHVPCILIAFCRGCGVGGGGVASGWVPWLLRVRCACSEFAFFWQIRCTYGGRAVLLIGGSVGFGMSPLEPRGDVIKDLFLYFVKCFLCIYSFFFFFF